jgi:FAD/FMN-containing dehydrogenase
LNREVATMSVRHTHSGDLAARLRGRLIQPGDADYEQARELWNGMIDRRPLLVVRCADGQDVATAVAYARDHDLPLAVRGGGHGVAGHAVCDGGLVIDLSDMRAVDVDPGGRTVRAEGGCTLADVDRATQRHGLATPLGVVSATGIAGLTLSGGMGWLRRQYGLSCDNLVSATVVTAGGNLVTASVTEHPDLFWAIRGGGGNFGVVTSFDYRLHPVGPEVFLCQVYYPVDHARVVLRACEEYLSEVPDQVGPIGVFGWIPEVDTFPQRAHGRPFVALLAVSPADPEGEAVQPLRDIADPICDLSGTMPYTKAQAFLDEDYPDGRRYYWKSVNVPELSDDLIERMARQLIAAPSSDSTLDVWFQGGAMAGVAEDETAFANRGAPYLLGIEGNWDEQADSPVNGKWVRDAFDDFRTFSAGGTYLNFPGFIEEAEDLLKEGYGTNYERLAQIKAAYDPANLFRLNANIPPRS